MKSPINIDQIMETVDLQSKFYENVLDYLKSINNLLDRILYSLDHMGFDESISFKEDK